MAAKRLRDKPDGDTLPELYSYYEQGQKPMAPTDGEGPAIPSPEPNMTLGRGAKGMSQDMAKLGYIKLVEHLKALAH